MNKSYTNNSNTDINWNNDINGNNLGINGNTINSTINQNNNITQVVKDGLPEKMIEYLRDTSTVRTITKNKINFRVKLYFGEVSLVSLVIYLFHLFGFDPFWLLLIFILAIAIVSMVNLEYLYCFFKLKNDGKAYFKWGNFYEKLDSGDCEKHVKYAKCIYPKCNGLVRIQVPPIKEQENHAFIGVCTEGGKRHTYTVDYHGIGFVQQFDWSKSEQKK